MTKRLTQAIVSEAANFLLDKNCRRPSNRDVYGHIGFGSNTKLTEFMAVWREENFSSFSSTPVLSERLLKEIQQLQLDATKEVRERYQQELLHLRESEQTLISSCNEQEATVEELRDTHHRQEQQLHALESRLADAQAQHLQVSQQLEQERHTAETLRIEVAKHALQSEQMELLRLELKECQENYRQACQRESEALLREAVLQERNAGFEKWVRADRALPTL